MVLVVVVVAITAAAMTSGKNGAAQDETSRRRGSLSRSYHGLYRAIENTVQNYKIQAFKKLTLSNFVCVGCVCVPTGSTPHDERRLFFPTSTISSFPVRDAPKVERSFCFVRSSSTREQSHTHALRCCWGCSSSKEGASEHHYGVVVLRRTRRRRVFD